MQNRFFNLSRSITIMRHSESLWNVSGRVQGRSGDPSITLSSTGRLAAQSLLMPKPHVLVSSPLLRCKQTAEAWFDTPFDKLTIQTQVSPNLLEIHAGIYEGRLIKELQNDPLWRHWMDDPATFPGFPGGETLPEFQSRVLRGFGEVCVEHGDANKHVCVITHGVVMRVLKCFLANQNLAHLWTHQATNLERIQLSHEQIIKFQQFYKQCSMSDTSVSPKRF